MAEDKRPDDIPSGQDRVKLMNELRALGIGAATIGKLQGVGMSRRNIAAELAQELNKHGNQGN